MTITESTATAQSQCALVLGPGGRLLAADDQGRRMWEERRNAVLALCRQPAEHSTGARSQLEFDGQDWQVTKMGLAGAGDGELTLVLLSKSPAVELASAGIHAEKHQALCRLASGIVHELRNPLASISLTAEILAMRPDLDASALEKLQDIVHHVERADEVLQSLRRLSREENPTMRIHSLNDLVHDAVRLEGGLLTARGIEVELDLDSEIPSVLADPSQLRLIVANLLRNGGEAMAEQGIRGRILVATSHRHGVVRLRVEDEGPGIPTELLSRIFEPYFTTKATGTGLGLAMSLGIAKAHGGHLRAEHRRPRGTRFLLDLPNPSHSTPARKAMALGVELPQVASASALLIDPDEGRLESLRAAVAAIGWKVHVAPDAGVALRKLRAADFDAVLVSIAPSTDAAVDLCARARLAQPEISGRLAVLLAVEPTAEQATRLHLAGATWQVDGHDPKQVQALVRALAGSRPGAGDAA